MSQPTVRRSTIQKRSGYSQERFARIIGVTPLTYRRLLACKANPMILLLYSISCRLNIELDQLLGFQPLDTADRFKKLRTFTAKSIRRARVQWKSPQMAKHYRADDVQS